MNSCVSSGLASRASSLRARYLGLSLGLELFFSWFGLLLFEVLPAKFHLLLADLECSYRWDIHLVENLVCISKMLFLRWWISHLWPALLPPGTSFVVRCFSLELNCCRLQCAVLPRRSAPLSIAVRTASAPLPPPGGGGCNFAGWPSALSVRPFGCTLALKKLWFFSWAFQSYSRGFWLLVDIFAVPYS